MKAPKGAPNVLIILLDDVGFGQTSTCGDIKYGRNTYDYQDRTLVFVAPGQVINVNINKDYKPQGYALLFYPDLIHGTPLGRHMDDYTFVSYESREALHLSEKERKIVLDCFSVIAPGSCIFLPIILATC